MRGIFELLVTKNITKATKRMAVCFVQRNKLIFMSFPDKTVKEFTFPQTAVADADVVNKEEYRRAVFEWTQGSAFRISDIMFLVSSELCFSKEIKNQTEKGHGSENETPISMFIDIVPYQHVFVAKNTTKDGTTQVVVSNKDLVLPLMHVFESIGFVTVGAFPELSVFSSSVQPLDEARFSDDVYKQVELYSLHTYVQYAFHTNADTHNKPITQMSVSEAAQQPINPLVAVVIVILMFGVGAYIMYWQFEQVRRDEMVATSKRIEKIAEQQAKLMNAQTSAPVLVAAPATVASNAATQKSVTATKVQIVYSEKTARVFDLVKASLVATYGYEVVGERSQSLPTGSNTLLSAKGTATQVRENVLKVLASVDIVPEVRESSVDGYAMVLTLTEYAPSAPSPRP